MAAAADRSADVTKLEVLIDEFTVVVGPLENFILPGGTIWRSAIACCAYRLPPRNARLPPWRAEESVGEHVLSYLNRLSDALFVMARFENHERSVPEPLWKPGA